MILPPNYVINLDRSVARLKSFRDRNLHLSNLTRFPAVDGASLDRQALIKAGTILDDCPYPAGTLGCALSHAALWRKACEENCYLTIFEDDTITALRCEQQMEELLGTLRADWDFILWGYALFEKLNLWVDLGVCHAKFHWYNQTDYNNADFQATDHRRSLLRLLNGWGTIAYSVSARGAQMLLESAFPLRKRVTPFSQPGIFYVDRGIDGPANAVYPSMRAFVCFPPLVVPDLSAVAGDRKGTDAQQR